MPDYDIHPDELTELKADLERLSALWVSETRENERLRAALTKIADPMTLDVTGVGFGRALSMMTAMRNIALAAIGNLEQ